MSGHVLVVGESVVDVVVAADGATVEHAGGSAANVAVALARLGRPVRLATSYADDVHGRLLADRLLAAGVEAATDPHVLDRTASATATLAPDGSASYEFDLAWRLGPLLPAASAPDYVHVCSLAAVLEPGADEVVDLLDRYAGEVPVSYDVNARPSVTGTGPTVVGRVEAVARRATLVKASDEDLAVLYPTLSLEAAAHRLRGLGPDVVVVTRGGSGAGWYGADGEKRVEAVAVDVVDTIGAGDTFSAGLLDALLRGEQPGEALAFAARAAAVTVSRPGADPPTRAELAR